MRKRVASHFSGGEQPGLAEMIAAVAQIDVRGDRDRGRGAAGRAEPHQAPPAALQRPPARRQVLPLHRGHARRGVPAGVLHARAHRRGRALLRPLLQRQAGARDARRARQACSVPHLRGARARPAQRHPLPRLLHQALRGALRGLRRRARTTARSSTGWSTSSPGATANIERELERQMLEAAAEERVRGAPRCTATGCRRSARCSSAGGRGRLGRHRRR